MTQEETKRVSPERNRGGEWVPIGGEEYLVPPLGFRSLKELRPRLEKLRGIDGSEELGDENFDTIVDVVYAALSRNYTKMTREDVLDVLDMGNFREVLAAVMSVNTRGVPQPGEEKADR